MAFNRVAIFDFESVALWEVACTQGARLLFSVQAGAAVPDKQPNNTAANIPTPKHAPVETGQAVPAFPSPSANGVVGRGKVTSADPCIPRKGAPSAERASPANPPTAGSSPVIHIVLQLLLCDALQVASSCLCSTNAGYGGGLASAHVYCCSTCPNLDTCQRQTFQQSVVSAVRVFSYMSALLPSLGLHHINQSLHHMPLHDLQVVFTSSVS